MTEATRTIPQKVSEHIISPAVLRAIGTFRVKRGLPTDQDAIRALLELGLAASQAVHEKPPVFPEALPSGGKIPGVPVRITRALACGYRLMAEAARYGDRPIPGQLKARLDRCATRQRRLADPPRRKRRDRKAAT